MSLANYQKITRVLPGRPFGDGSDGDLTISSNTTQSVANASCSGSSGSNSLTLGAASSFSNGDLVIIHQTRGTGSGNWEINMISSGGGTTSLTLQQDLQNTYTDSGASQAQIVKIPRYQDVTVNSSVTWSAPAWTKNTGGILVFAAKGITTIQGTISADGLNGSSAYSGTPSGGNGRGFVGGNGDISSLPNSAWCGEGTSGDEAQQTSPNGTGGGGGSIGGTPTYATGAGGGHATSGGNGESSGGAAPSGGGTAGAAQLTTMIFGGGGGGGAKDPSGTSNYAAGGGGGAGIVAMFAKTPTISGGVSLDGGNGGTTSGSNANGEAGGGAGGSCLIVADTATLGSSLITASGGSGGSRNGVSGGNGGNGRVALHYNNSYTGTTSPTITATQDTTLIETDAGLLMGFI